VSIKWIDNIEKADYGDTADVRTEALALVDNGLGSLVHAQEYDLVMGTINYATGECIITDAKRSYTKVTYTRIKKKKWYGSAYWISFPVHTEAVTNGPDAFSTTARVSTSVASANVIDTITSPDLQLNLLPNIEDNSIVPNSIVFTLDGSTYYDVGQGSIYKDKDTSTGVGTYAGAVSYDSGIVTLDTHANLGSTQIVLLYMLCKDFNVGVSEYVFRTPGAPIRNGSFSCRANDVDNSTQYTAIAATNGDISDTGISGFIDTAVGIVRLLFGEMVTAAGNELEPWYDADGIVEGYVWKPADIIPETALYNAVYYSTLPLDAELVGIEPIRLPTDGRVPIFKSGDVCVIHHTDTEALGTTFTASQVITLSRGFLSIIDLYDYLGVLVPEAYYTYDLDAGTITITADVGDLASLNALTASGTENIVCNHRIEDMILLSEAQINGFLTSVGPITHDYPAIGAQLSTALIFGDLAGRIIRIFHQKTWDGVWRDSLSGDDSTAKYDTLNYPFIIQNEGSASQRWCLKFVNADEIQLIGETLGVIENAGNPYWNIANTIAPNNPATGTPYFTITNTGWGGGWATGNNIRFDTTAANFPVWLARTTMQGSVTEPTDNFVMQIRGDAN
jgi:hypothetical protein